MVVGILQVELAIPGSGSLKDKRRVVRSLKDRLHRDLKLAVAEVGYQDALGRAGIGISVVGTDGRRVAQVLDHADEMIRRQTDAQVVLTRRWVVRTKDLPDEEDSVAYADELSHEALAAELLEHFDEQLNEQFDGQFDGQEEQL